jgi:hypothetical protein
MKKLAFGLILSFIIFSGFTDNQIWIRAKMPENIHSGDKFTIEFTINKLDLQHFAELKQKLPNGFKAIEKQSGSAQFSFKDQMVKFTWVRLPRTPQFTISYEVVVDPNVKGNFSLPAQLTYIYKNQRGTASLDNDKIKVYAKGEVYSFNENNENSDINFPPKNPNLVQCLRIQPYYMKEHKGFIVKLLVSRGNIQSAAKIEEKIPNGYVAQVIDGKTAAFTFDNNKALFIWKKMPTDKNFEISYKISLNQVNPELPVITGNFTYLIGGSFQTTVIKEVEQSKLNKTTNQDFDKKEVLNFFNE